MGVRVAHATGIISWRVLEIGDKAQVPITLPMIQRRVVPERCFVMCSALIDQRVQQCAGFLVLDGLILGPTTPTTLGRADDGIRSYTCELVGHGQSRRCADA